MTPARVSLAFASVAVVAEAVALATLPVGGAEWAVAPRWIGAAYGAGGLACHAGIVAVLLALAWRSSKRWPHGPATPLTLLLMLAAGPIGALAGWLAAAVAALAPESWRADPLELTENAGEPSAAVADAAKKGGMTMDPQPLADIFRTGTMAQRRAAVALIGGNFKPEFAPILRMALADEHNAIRVQAGMVLLSLEDEFGKRRSDLEAQADPLLASHGFGREETELELARLYDEQAFAGLLDADRTRTAQAHAARFYRAHLQKHPDDLEAIAALGRLLVRANQYALVADWLTDQMRQGRHTPATLMWLAEALFGARRYAELRDLIQRHGDRLFGHLPPDSPLRPVLSLWLQETRDGADPGKRQTSKIAHV